MLLAAATLPLHLFLLALHFADLITCSTTLLTQQCYSCMSASMGGARWQYLEKIYIRPVNFTDDCNEPMNQANIGTRPCTAVCLTISEEVYMSGTFVGRSYIRGCLDKIAKWGFRNSTIRFFERYDDCKDLNRQDLLRNALDEVDGSGNVVTVCSCYGDRCNGVRPNSASSLSILPQLLLLAWTLLAGKFPTC